MKVATWVERFTPRGNISERNLPDMSIGRWPQEGLPVLAGAAPGAVGGHEGAKTGVDLLLAVSAKKFSSFKLFNYARNFIQNQEA
jgi:hypothetical protein